MNNNGNISTPVYSSKNFTPILHFNQSGCHLVDFSVRYHYRYFLLTSSFLFWIQIQIVSWLQEWRWWYLQSLIWNEWSTLLAETWEIVILGYIIKKHGDESKVSCRGNFQKKKKANQINLQAFLMRKFLKHRVWILFHSSNSI